MELYSLVIQSVHYIQFWRFQLGAQIVDLTKKSDLQVKKYCNLISSKNYLSAYANAITASLTNCNWSSNAVVFFSNFSLVVHVRLYFSLYGVRELFGYRQAKWSSQNSMEKDIHFEWTKKTVKFSRVYCLWNVWLIYNKSYIE